MASARTTYTFHLLGNAHLDPVWLWDWREGLNQGLITCRTILDLMDEFPALTFNRGEAAIYDHIEKTDPATFARIKKYVKAGRWDYVGGTWIQPDENMPATETLVREYARGQQYFTSRFGKPVRVAWSADCFGHSGGLPEIQACAGIEYFAFTRPDAKAFPIERAAFWWEGPGGSRILCYRPVGVWYGTERDETAKRLDATLAGCNEHDLRTAGVFFGLGDHGGGPTRRQIADFAEWAKAHPEVRLVYSTMHRFFDELKRECLARGPKFLPVVDRELNFALRGCYASAARFKYQFRKAEADITRAERALAAVGATLGKSIAAPALPAAWDAVLFNAFHDILPGTSLERAMDEQCAQVGGVQQAAVAAEFEALNALANQVDTRVLPAAGPDLPTGIAGLVWNPHPVAFDGFVEFEGCLDDRMIWKYLNRPDEMPVRVLDERKRPAAHQRVAVENDFSLHAPWRARALVPMKLAPMGWSVLEMGYFEGAAAPAGPQKKLGVTAKAGKAKAEIKSSIYRVRAAKGAAGIVIERNGKHWIGGAGLAAALYDDPSGSWGSDGDDPKRGVVEKFRITDVALRESGPWRAAIWVRLAGKRSWIDLTVQLYAGRDAVDISARALLNDRSTRLRLVFPMGGKAEFDVPGATVLRGPSDEVPARNWVRLADGSLGIATDALYSFNIKAHQTLMTVARTSRFAESVSRAGDVDPWRPAQDIGEHKFRFLIAPGDERLEQLSRELEYPPRALLVPAKAGKLPARGGLIALSPGNLELLALKPAEDGKGVILRVRETTGRRATPKLKIGGKSVTLPAVEGQRIATYRVQSSGGKLAAKRCDAAERD